MQSSITCYAVSMLSESSVQAASGATDAPIHSSGYTPRTEPASSGEVFQMPAIERLREDISHTKAKNALNEIMLAATSGSGRPIVMVVGPPGVGKSHLVGPLERKLGGLDIPTVSVGLSQEGKVDFNFKSMFMSIYDRLPEPPLPTRRAPILPHEKVAESGRGTCRFRSAAVKALNRENKRPVILMDECAHILNVKGSDNLTRHGQTLRSFGHDAKAVLVMFCSYNGIPLLKIDTELLRRIKVIHFSRYDESDPKDLKDYRNVVMSVGKLLGLHPKSLEKWVLPLIRSTFGCVGTTMDVFKEAVMQPPLEDGSFDYESIKRCMPSAQYSVMLARTVLENEQEIGQFL